MQAAKGGKQSVVLPHCHTWEPQQWPAWQNTHIAAGTQLNKTRRKKKEKPSKKQQTEDFKFV